MEDIPLDEVTIDNLFHLNQIKQLDAMLSRICTGMDHRRSDMNTLMTHSAAPHVTFLFLLHFDISCGL